MSGTDAPYEVTRHNGLIIAACVCGSGESVIDKGLGRAVVAAWRTRHQDCVDPVSRVQAIEAAEDHADQTAFDAWRERGL